MSDRLFVCPDCGFGRRYRRHAAPPECHCRRWARVPPEEKERLIRADIEDEREMLMALALPPPALDPPPERMPPRAWRPPAEWPAPRRAAAARLVERGFMVMPDGTMSRLKGAA